MQVKFAFWKIDSISEGSEVSTIDFGPPPVPSVIVEVKTLAELSAARDAYAAPIQLCGRVMTYKFGRDRAIPGFVAFAAKSPLVNREIGEAAYVG